MYSVFQIRRVVLSLLLVSASVVLARGLPRLEAALPHFVYLTGWALLILCLFLTAYNARKKLPFLPLLASRVWLQLHAYVGLFTGFLFLVHLRFAVPRGPLNLVLASLFVGVTLSGILGGWLSRSIPRRLTSAGGEVPFERIPTIRRDLRLKAESIALASIPEANCSTLADFYARTLAPVFAAGPAFLPHLVGSRAALNHHLAALAETGRYLSAVEKTRAHSLADLVRARHVLDFHHAHQLLLKSWLFTHIPLTYGLLVLSAVHILLVHAFSGGAR